MKCLYQARNSVYKYRVSILPVSMIFHWDFEAVPTVFFLHTIIPCSVSFKTNEPCISSVMRTLNLDPEGRGPGIYRSTQAVRHTCSGNFNFFELQHKQKIHRKWRKMGSLLLDNGALSISTMINPRLIPCDGDASLVVLVLHIGNILLLLQKLEYQWNEPNCV